MKADTPTVPAQRKEVVSGPHPVPMETHRNGNSEIFLPCRDSGDVLRNPYGSASSTHRTTVSPRGRLPVSPRRHAHGSMTEPSEVTHLLRALGTGDETVVDALFDHTYEELRHLAHRQLQRLRPGQTLNTTALVHEAYLKLVDQSAVSWEDRAHFFSVAAKAMRHLIVDYARRKSAEKRGGDTKAITFEEGRMAPQESAEALVMVDRALDRLAEQDERMAKVVELRFFGGMTQKESAEVLDVSTRTVRRDWTAARAWLSRALSEENKANEEVSSDDDE